LDSIIKCFSGNSSSSSSSADDDPTIIGLGNEETVKFIECLFKFLSDNVVDASVKANGDLIEGVALTVDIINNYGQGKGLGTEYSPTQMCFIKEMKEIVNEVPLDSFIDYLQNIQNKIAVSSLTNDEKTPLYIAVSVGMNNYAYWIDKIKNGEGLWTEYLDTLEGIKADIPFYVNAAIEGALMGYSAKYQGCECITGIDMLFAVGGSLALGAGKVIFKWMPVKNENCNTDYTQPQILTFPASEIPVNFSNPNNPYDNIGAAHNSACDFVKQHCLKLTKTDDIINSLNLYLTKEYGFSQFKDEIYPKYKSFLPNSNLTAVEIRQLIQADLQRGSINHNMFNALCLLFDRIDKITLGIPNLQEIISFMDDIKKIENYVIGNSSFTNDEKAIILKTSSVMRYSGYYWYSALISTSNPWHGQLNHSTARIPGWLGADAVGAYTSTQIGAANLGGLLGGPWGYFGTVVAFGAASSIISVL
jgi:hypothetical protein